MHIYSAKKDITASLQQDLLTQRVGERDILMGRDKDNLHLYEQGEQDFRNAMERVAAAACNR